jgi:predicted phosphoribosyltransferase
MATGNTLLSTINMLRKEAPAKIVVAVPVAPASAVEKIRPLVDEIIVPLVPHNFYGVGGFYEDFQQVSDEEVIQLLQEYFSHGLSNTKEN